MQVAHAVVRGATAPIRFGLSVAWAVLDEVRRAVSGEGAPRTGVPVDAVVPARAAPHVPSAAAAEGVGAEVRASPPWQGYDEMTAAEISKRLARSDGEAAAAASLYERAGRARRTVLEAADRRLRALSG